LEKTRVKTKLIWLAKVLRTGGGDRESYDENEALEMDICELRGSTSVTLFHGVRWKELRIVGSIE
jgi:hypothetical protein